MPLINSVAIAIPKISGDQKLLKICPPVQIRVDELYQYIDTKSKGKVRGNVCHQNSR